MKKLVLFLFCIVIFLYFCIIILNLLVSNKEGFTRIIENNKDDERNIPYNIFQTWNTKELPPKMKENVELLQKQNPQYKYYLFDDQDCRNFIQTYYTKNVLDAYDKLIPTAYKADLWRYCVLYKYGGVYLDMKMQCENDFHLIDLEDKEYYVKDRIDQTDIGSTGIFNAIMINKKNSPYLLDCIQRIIDNVNQKYYGTSCLHPTGPKMMGELYLLNKQNYNLPDFEIIHEDNGNITYHGKVIMNQYKEYRNEQRNSANIPHYGILWKNRIIYASDEKL